VHAITAALISVPPALAADGSSVPPAAMSRHFRTVEFGRCDRRRSRYGTQLGISSRRQRERLSRTG